MSLRNTLIALLLLATAYPLASQDFYEDFNRLDKALGMAGDYVATHESKTAAIRSLLEAHEPSPAEAYDLYGRLYKAEYTFRFDSAREALERKEEAALALKDPSRISETNVEKATLYCIAGMYLESMQAAEQIDTTCLDSRQMIDYFYFQQRFNSDFREFTQNLEDRESMLSKTNYYRRRILEETEPASSMHRLMEVRGMIDGGRFHEADSVSILTLSTLNPESHEYAELAYWEGTICRELGRWEEMMSWFAKSAAGDVKSATKDNASLQTIAIELLNADRDIERAFRYTQFSLNDALFFNARLRPWQIAQYLPDIEAAYTAARDIQEKRARALTHALFVLALVLLGALVLVLVFFTRQKVTQKKIKDMNVRLQAAMEDLSKANAAKEEYIGLFLTMCSSYIDKLKKFLSMSQIDEELKNFYKTFDNAFLQLYPDFVEKFNALLIPEARIELRKDELLNTELRIFAVIKLGITQSSHIATLLRYSVNTIYNYRAQVKNAAIAGKDSFEDLVRAI